MKDYLITVYTNGRNKKEVLSERTIGKSEEYLEGLIKGLELSYPKHTVTKEIIPKN